MLLDITTVFNALNHNYTEASFTGVSALARGTLNTPANKARQITSVCRILRLMRLVYLYNRYELHKQVTTALLTASHIALAYIALAHNSSEPCSCGSSHNHFAQAASGQACTARCSHLTRPHVCPQHPR